MRFRSVCSGIEAASVAWLPLGWECVSVAEIDPFASAVLAHRYPETFNCGDFTKIEAEPGSADVLVGGTPCQSFSVAGLRGGMADARGNLALEFLRLAGRTRPRWVVWENVPGVLSSNGGRDFGAFLGGLAELGYGWSYRVLDAQYFGLAQRRQRVFVVGCLGDWRPAAAVLLERDGLSGNPPPGREAGSGTAPCVIKGAAIGREPHNGPQYGEILEDGTCYTLNCTETHGGLHASPTPGVARSLTCHSGRYDGDTENFVVTHSLRADGFDASEDGTGRGTPLVPVAFDYGVSITSGSRLVGDPGGPAFSTMAGRQQAIAFGWYERSGAVASEISPTLKVSDGHVPSVHAYSALRRLTPRECERLQGFPDDWTLVPYRGKPAADGPRYRAIGNSMAVPVMAWIGRRIQMVEEALR